MLPIIMSMTIIIPLFTLPAYAQKNVTISPNCGTEEGFEVTLETDGFGQNSNVHWDLVDTKNNTIALSGYFATNSSGGFEEPTFVDDINSGDYKIKVFDDADTNDKLDTNKTELSLNFSIPCKNQ
ncbi:MAG TPA: hypothetical protein VF222_08475 [Nitrososphaeraceae archaeon]